MNVHEFLVARVGELRDVVPLVPRDLPERVQPYMRLTDAGGRPILATRQTVSQDIDALMVVLDAHRPQREGGGDACVGCGLDIIGDWRAGDIDDCPTLHALAWRWHRHADWQTRWTVPTSVPVTTWPPSENCYCGGPGELYAHRHGTGHYCRRTA